jgi:hypothetical protein
MTKKGGQQPHPPAHLCSSVWGSPCLNSLINSCPSFRSPSLICVIHFPHTTGSLPFG